PEPRSCSKEHLAFGEILSAWTDMGLAGNLAHRYGSRPLVGVLLNDDEIGAFRHRRAGEDADGFAPADAPAEARARNRPSNKLQLNGNSGDVGGADGITGHRRGSEGGAGR